MKRILIFFIFINGVLSQEIICTDLAGQSTGPLVLPKSRVQLETGVSLFFPINYYSFPIILLRYGVNKNVELRYSLNNDFSKIDNSKIYNWVGTKLQFVNKDKWQLGFIHHFILYETENKVNIGVNSLLSFNYSINSVSLYTNLGYNSYLNVINYGFYVLGISYNFSPYSFGYIEFYNNVYSAKYEVPNVNIGFNWAVKNNIELALWSGYEFLNNVGYTGFSFSFYPMFGKD